MLKLLNVKLILIIFSSKCNGTNSVLMNYMQWSWPVGQMNLGEGTMWEEPSTIKKLLIKYLITGL